MSATRASIAATYSLFFSRARALYARLRAALSSFVDLCLLARAGVAGIAGSGGHDGELGAVAHAGDDGDDGELGAVTNGAADGSGAPSADPPLHPSFSVASQDTHAGSLGDIVSAAGAAHS